MDEIITNMKEGMSHIRRPLPSIGKIYNAFDDGKIRCSRQEKVVILDIIHWDDARRHLRKIFKKNAQDYDWIFSKDFGTDYFIIAKHSCTLGDEASDDLGTITVFARTQKGDWYTLSSSQHNLLGTPSKNIPICGNCVLDVDGSLTQWLKGACERGEFTCDYFENVSTSDIEKTFVENNIQEYYKRNIRPNLVSAPKCKLHVYQESLEIKS